MSSENNENVPPVPVVPPSLPTTAPKPMAPTTKPKLSNVNSNAKTNGSVSNGSNGSPTGLRVLRPELHVGFDSLPDQYVSRIIRDGFGFNILALGATGVGKTTLLEALFNTKIVTDSGLRNHGQSSVSVTTQQLELNEGNIKLKLSLVESKGFGDQIDKSKQ